jgi:hypothetical protein
VLLQCPNYDQGEKDNEDIMVLPDHLFIRTMSMQCRRMPIHPKRIITVREMMPSNPSDVQDKTILHPWVDPHQLKKLNGAWYKEGQQVVMKGSKKK